MKHKVIGLLLAAGASRRIGSPKQLLPWGKSTMIDHCISEALRSDLNSLVVVLGAEAEQIHPTIQSFDIDIVINMEWVNGMSSTIQSGIEQITSKESPDGILIMLADQPFVSTEYLNQLLSEFRSVDDIVASTYKHGLGVPALFGSSHFELLGNLEGDKGAGSILTMKSDSIKAMPISSMLTDIDTKEAYNSLRPPSDK